MGYQSKTYSLSDEVVAAIDEAKAKGESPNKFLKRVLREWRFTWTESAIHTPVGDTAGGYLDAIGPELSSGRGKASIETRQMRQKGDTKR